MVNRRMKPAQVLALIRRLAREKGLALAEIPGRGKGSHRLYVLTDADGNEVARFFITYHPKDLSWTVLRSIEDTLAPVLGQNWTETP